MRRLQYIYLAAVAVLAGCSSAGSPYEQKAIEHGRADAQKVIDAPEGSLQRENAVLHIRATEYRLIQAGDSLAAKAYVQAAEALLDSAAVWGNEK